MTTETVDGELPGSTTPLMETAQDFRAALIDAIEIRRQRLAAHA